jgi:hypothetical protein
MYECALVNREARRWATEKKSSPESRCRKPMLLELERQPEAGPLKLNSVSPQTNHHAEPWEMSVNEISKIEKPHGYEG